MDQTVSALIAAAVPTFAVIVAGVRNEWALSGPVTRIGTLESRLDARIETLHRDLREWAKITMNLNTDVHRLKDKAGLD